MDLDRSIAELYAKPLAEFTAERDRLTKELRDAGDARAAEVKKFRKPSLPVWAVNRLSSAQPKEFAELVTIGKKLRDAHAELLAGGEPDAVRTLAEEERGVVARLAGQAKTILEEAGEKPSPATLERVKATLLGLATDPQAAEVAKAGRLDREITRGGFEDASFEAVEPSPEVRERRAAAAASKAAVRRAREKADKARRRADDARRRADDLFRQAEEQAAEAEKLARRAGDARKAAEEAEAEAVEAETEAARLEQD